MGKVHILILFVFSFWAVLTEVWGQSNMDKRYHAVLQLNDRRSIPFDVTYSAGNLPRLTIHNGEEQIDLRFLVEKHDSIFMEFPEIAGKIIFHKQTLNGRWINLNKSNPTSYPFLFYSVAEGLDPRFDLPLDLAVPIFEGIYDVIFTDSEGDAQAIGIFKQTGSNIEGTFRTETGDYRYLSGGIFNGVMKLSCFDGVHAFLFEVAMDTDDSTVIRGNFYSGSKYHATWTGVLNPNAKLTPPNAISWPNEPLAALNIAIKTKKGKEKSLDTDFFYGKPSVIQLMGTWCPNCLDESKYFIELSKQTAYKDIRFIGVGFENGNSDKDRLVRLKKYQKKMAFTYPLYLGGGASTKDAHAVFNQLNGVFSFPTTIFLDKKGRIVQVNSGFDGPATGVFYKSMQEETEQLLLKLLQADE
ncbi:MAG: TlpA family protein disulfide reductase [Flavobacteriales bacterium]